MKVYTGNDGKIESIRLSEAKGYGLFHTAKYDARPYPYHALDNGAYSAWINEEEWVPAPFLQSLSRYEELGPVLDFVVVPDIVGGGHKSLTWSLDWVNRLKTNARKYLAVQDGLEPRDVTAHLPRFGGIFVGGTLQWKYSTAKTWIATAHEARIPCHIGRVGTWDRIRWAALLGADSIDSTSWARNNSYHHIERAASTVGLEQFAEAQVEE